MTHVSMSSYPVEIHKFAPTSNRLLPSARDISTTTRQMDFKFRVGQRLSYGNDLCTVRYIGSVEGKGGEWLGLEWDTVQRGKHSGEHAGRKYFTCLSLSLFLVLSIPQFIYG